MTRRLYISKVRLTSVPGQWWGRSARPPSESAPVLRCSGAQLLAKTQVCWLGTRSTPRRRGAGCSSRARWAYPARRKSGDRWSADHLFLDQDGIPTLVEVKRRKDTRIRREVVGQMLEYAANAVVYWSLDRFAPNS